MLRQIPPHQLHPFLLCLEAGLAVTFVPYSAASLRVALVASVAGSVAVTGRVTIWNNILIPEIILIWVWIIVAVIVQVRVEVRVAFWAGISVSEKFHGEKRVSASLVVATCDTVLWAS